MGGERLIIFKRKTRSGDRSYGESGQECPSYGKIASTNRSNIKGKGIAVTNRSYGKGKGIAVTNRSYGKGKGIAVTNRSYGKGKGIATTSRSCGKSQSGDCSYRELPIVT